MSLDDGNFRHAAETRSSLSRRARSACFCSGYVPNERHHTANLAVRGAVRHVVRMHRARDRGSDDVSRPQPLRRQARASTRSRTLSNADSPSTSLIFRPSKSWGGRANPFLGRSVGEAISLVTIHIEHHPGKPSMSRRSSASWLLQLFAPPLALQDIAHRHRDAHRSVRIFQWISADLPDARHAWERGVTARAHAPSTAHRLPLIRGKCPPWTRRLPAPTSQPPANVRFGGQTIHLRQPLVHPDEAQIRIEETEADGSGRD